MKFVPTKLVSQQLSKGHSFWDGCTMNFVPTTAWMHAIKYLATNDGLELVVAPLIEVLTSDTLSCRLHLFSPSKGDKISLSSHYVLIWYQSM